MFPRLLLLIAAAGALSFAPAGAQTIPSLAPCPGRQAAEQCFERAMEAAAQALENPGPTSAARVAAAVTLLDSTCGLGLADACYFSGRLLVTVSADSTPIDTLQARAVALFRRGCAPEPPSPEACTSLGDSYAYGMGVDAHPDTAAAYYQRGCEAGSPTACAREAELLQSRPEFGRAWADQALRRSRDACEQGSPLGCLTLAATRERELSARPEAERRSARFRRERDSVVATYRRLCDDGRGQVGACGRLGAVLEEGRLGVRPDPAAALRYYEMGCRGRDLGDGTERLMGDGDTCKRLGTLAAATPSRDPGEYFQAGCMLGAAEPCVEVARLLAEEEFSSRRPEYALAYLRMACERSSGKGCSEMGRMLESVFLDDNASSKALAFFHESCGMDFGEGCLNAAFRADDAGDLRTTLRYARRACEVGHVLGCTALGFVLANAYGDWERAERLFIRACDMGEPRGCAAHAQVRRRANDFVGEGMALARMCRADPAFCKRKDDLTQIDS